MITYLNVKSNSLISSLDPNIRPFILATRTMVPDLPAHMEALDEGPENSNLLRR